MPRIDHFAFSVHGASAWLELRVRVEASGLRHDISRVPASGEVQLFVEAAPGLNVGFLLDQSGDGLAATAQ